jgi:hypothetical protein
MFIGTFAQLLLKSVGSLKASQGKDLSLLCP